MAASLRGAAIAAPKIVPDNFLLLALFPLTGAESSIVCANLDCAKAAFTVYYATEFCA